MSVLFNKTCWQEKCCQNIEILNYNMAYSYITSDHYNFINSKWHNIQKIMNKFNMYGHVHLVKSSHILKQQMMYTQKNKQTFNYNFHYTRSNLFRCLCTVPD